LQKVYLKIVVRDRGSGHPEAPLKS
jgi:hypothetical protein